MSCPFERLADVPEVWILIFTDFGERPSRAALAGVSFYLFFTLLGRQKARQKFRKPPQTCFLFGGKRFLRQLIKAEESVKTRHLLLRVNRRSSEIAAEQDENSLEGVAET